jgi:hypothetical protein
MLFGSEGAASRHRMFVGVHSIVCSVSGGAWRFLHLAGGTQSVGQSPAAGSLFSTTDTISIWLAALGIMIALASLVVTGVGLFVGALAIFGYQTFSDQVDRRVGEAVPVALDKFFGGPQFDTQLEGKVKEHLKATSWQSGTATAETPGTGFNVKRYPKKKA